MKKHFLLLFTLITCVDLLFANESINGITYSLHGSDLTASVEKSNYSGNVVIPQKVTSYSTGKTYSVTSIGSSAFSGCSGLTSITIPYSVTSIGSNAFQNCTGLTTVTIPYKITKLSSKVFSGCTNLTYVVWNATKCEDLYSEDSQPFPPSVTSIVFGDDVERIPAYLCYDLKNLTSVQFNDNITEIGKYAFYGCTALTNFEIPDGIQNIGTSAFGHVKHVLYNGEATGSPWGACCINGFVENEYVYEDSSRSKLLACLISAYDMGMPKSVTSIGAWAFCDCKNLVAITIPNSVVSIGNNAFQNCTSLITVELANNVPNIGNDIFYGCTSLTSPIYNDYVFIFMPSTQKGTYDIPNGIVSIAGGAFDSCSDLTSIKIPNSVKTIGDYAFYGCTGLSSIEIPENVVRIGYGAFYDCNALTAITIPDRVSRIEGCAFCNCSRLASITFSENIKSIDEYAFYNCKALKSITMPSDVISIGQYAFYYCSGLTSIEIPNNVTDIGDFAFYYCFSLASVNIGNNVTSLGNKAFYECSKLTSVVWNAKNCLDSTFNVYGSCFPTSITSFVFGENVEHIPAKLCNSMKYLTSITIPSSVNSIGENAFYGCSGLNAVFVDDLETWCNIQFEDNPLTYAHHLFVNEKEITNLVVPENVTRIKNRAFSGGSDITNVILHNKIICIGDYAFNNCTGLTKIDIPSSVTSIEWSAFNGCSNLDTIYVPCGEMENFQLWLNNHHALQYKSYPFKVEISQTEHGNVKVPTTICDSDELIATPDYGYHFAKWNDGNTDNPRKVEISQDTTFQFLAEYEKNQYALIDISNKDRGYIKGAGSYDFNTEITIEAIPNYGYHFESWSDGEGVYDIPQDAMSISEARWLIQQTLEDNEKSKKEYTICGYIIGHYENSTDSYYISDYPSFGAWNPMIVFKPSNSAKIGDFVCVKGRLYNDWASAYRYGVYNGGEITKLEKRSVDTRIISLTRDTCIEAIFAPNKYVIQGNTDISRGHVEGTGSFDYLSNQTLTAVNEHGYCFKQWSDGNTDNPRTIVLTKDTVFTAIFDYATTGYCGDDYALTWVYNREDKALTISGTGKLNSNYDFGLEAPSEVEKLIIEDGVTSIGEAAFKNYTTLTSVSVAASVKTIYEQAFYNCLNLQNFYCFREYPSVVYNNTFEGVDKFECTLHVPSTSIDMYKAATGWRDFYFIIANSDLSTSVEFTPVDQPNTTKLLRDGQILILRGEKVYTVTGQEVR